MVARDTTSKADPTHCISKLIPLQKECFLLREKRFEKMTKKNKCLPDTKAEEEVGEILHDSRKPYCVRMVCSSSQAAASFKYYSMGSTVCSAEHFGVILRLPKGSPKKFSIPEANSGILSQSRSHGFLAR